MFQFYLLQDVLFVLDFITRTSPTGSCQLYYHSNIMSVTIDCRFTFLNTLLSFRSYLPIASWVLKHHYKFVTEAGILSPSPWKHSANPWIAEQACVEQHMQPANNMIRDAVGIRIHSPCEGHRLPVQPSGNPVGSASICND